MGRSTIRSGWAVLLALVPLGAPAAQGREDREKRAARAFVESAASSIFEAAWPTATYEHLSVERIDRVEGGVDALAKLSGKSAFGGGGLWVRMVFELRGGVFSDIRLIGHSFAVVPPFQTRATLGGVGAVLSGSIGWGSSAGSASVLTAGDSVPGDAVPAGAARGKAAVDAVPIEAVPVEAASTVLAPRQLRFTSDCPRPITLWMRTRSPDASWATRGAWALKARDTTFLADEHDLRLELSSAVVYYYAEIPGTDLSWRGNRRVDYAGKALPMRTDTLPARGTAPYRLHLTCSTLLQPAPVP